MSLLPKVTAKNKQVETKIGRASEYIVSTIESQQADLESLEFQLGARPEGVKSPDYLERVAAETTQKLGELGIGDWSADLAASQAASQVPNTYGYGNEGVRIWDKDHHSLIFVREVELATVQVLQPAEVSVEQLAA